MQLLVHLQICIMVSDSMVCIRIVSRMYVDAMVFPLLKTLKSIVFQFTEYSYHNYLSVGTDD